MNTDDRFLEHLFHTHSKETIGHWISSLKYFHYQRAQGGHANDGDAFEVAFAYTDEPDLLFKLRELSITPRYAFNKLHPENEDTGETGYSTIRRFPDMQQPGKVTIGGEDAFLWVNDHNFEISVSGTADRNYYEVSESDFQKCLKLEKIFDTFGWQNDVVPHRMGKYSITKEQYGDLFR